MDRGSIYQRPSGRKPSSHHARRLTGQKTQLHLRVEAGQVTLLRDTLSLGVLPVLHRLRLKAIAEVPVEQIPGVTVGIWGTADDSGYHSS